MKTALTLVLFGLLGGATLAVAMMSLPQEQVPVKEGSPVAASPTSPAAASPFDRTLELQGISFRITSANNSSLNALRIVPSGLEAGNPSIVRTIDGTVTDAEVADLDKDGSPELYVYVTSVGSGSYGSLVAFAVNRRRSLSEIYLPPVTRNKKIAMNYRGHDKFAITGGALVQRFPLYRDTDANAHPTGGTRQIHYRLVPGEAGWLLAVDKVVEQ